MYSQKLPLWYSIVAILLIGVFGIGLFQAFYGLDYDWDFSFLGDFFWDPKDDKPGLILLGLWGTIYISLISIVIGSGLGLLVGTLLITREPVTRFAAVFYVDVFRNTPVLVQLYVVYFIVGTAIEMSPETAGILTLSLFCSAYVAEIFRGTLQEFEKGQIDAAKALGLTRWQTARHIIAPQALRRMLPPLIGQFVSLVKDSSLVSVISVVDLTKSAMNVVAVSFRSLETWFIIALIYFVLNLVLSTVGRKIEQRLRVSS
ncbi:MAG: amino acid ABC transporter permease [Pseudobacteriovorax sp.]|nr:amino acid ABC transporter permease [Pseudobacteriovorax sp.]